MRREGTTLSVHPGGLQVAPHVGLEDADFKCYVCHGVHNEVLAPVL